MKLTLAGFLLVLSVLLTGCVESDSSSSGGDSSSPSETQPDPVATTGTVQLSWNAPKEREDGSPLPAGHIDRYEIHYGQVSGDYDQITEIAANGSDTATINSLTEGTWYFAVKAVDLEERASRFSDEQSVSIE
ncbi:MAG: fibronectin type III domain-containing protein [Ectothiorhodospiraceae bacterium]|nr:fibronectin type III domain-containing protein [Ectothiorhodospiraceae bacterium]